MNLKLNRAHEIAKSLNVPKVLHPFRGAFTWAFQRGVLSSRLRKYLPHRWPLEPFTIYGTGWTCLWSPTQFDDVGRRIFWSGLREWEKETSPVILDNIRRARCFIDIGANCGIYSVIACKINSEVKVVAIEPVPRICTALRNNVSVNSCEKRVSVLNIALADTEGPVSFHEADEATMGSLALDGYQGRSGVIIQVECKRLDSVVDELGIEPDFMKIDVEGFEHLVLKGGTKVLQRFRPRIVLEANPGDPGDAMTEILLRYGYKFQLITHRGLELRPEIIPDQIFHNWLCTSAN